MSTIKSLRFDISSSWDGGALDRARADLETLKRDIDEINGKTARVDVQVNTAAARQELDDIKRDLDEIGSRTANARVTADTGSARTSLDGLRAQLDETTRTRTAQVRATDEGVDSVRAKLDELAHLREAKVNAKLAGDADVEARLKTLIHDRTAEIKAKLEDAGIPERLALLSRTRHAKIIVDVDKSKLEDLKKSLDDLSKKLDFAKSKAATLAQAIIALAPAIVPLSAAVLGLGGALVSSFGSATLALTPFAASLFGTYKSASTLASTVSTLRDHLEILRQAEAKGVNEHKQIVETQLKINQAMKNATPIQREVANSMLDLGDAWKKFQTVAEKSTGPVLASGFNAVTAALPKMIPLVQAVAPLFQAIVDKAAAFAKSNGMTKFVDWIIAVGVPNLKNIMDTIGHLFVTIGQIMKAFAPEGLSFTKWLSDVTKKLNDWGKGGGFQRFADQVKKDWPEVKALLIAVGKAIENIIKALAGFGPASLSGFTLLMQAISKLSPGEIQALAVAFVALRLALVGLAVVSGIASAIEKISKAIDTLRDALLAARFAAFAFEMSLAPFLVTVGLIIAVVIALGVVIFLLITHWKEFSTYISSSFMHAMNDLWSLLKIIGAWISGVFAHVWDGLKAAWNAAWNGLKTGAQAVANFFSGPFLTPFKAVGAFFSGPFVRFFTDAIPRIAAAIGRWTSGAAAAVAHFVTSIGQKIGQFFSGPFVRFFTDAIPKIVGAIGRWTAGAASAVAHFVTSIGQKIGQFFSGPFVRFFTDAIPKIAGAIGRWTIGAVAAVGHFLTSIGQAIGRFFSGPFVRFFTDAIPHMVSAIGRWAAGVVGAIAHFFASMAKDVATGITHLVSMMLKGGGEIAKALMEGLIHGLEAGVGAVIGKAEDLGKKVLGGLKKIFKIFSPSMETHQMGLDLNEGLGNGITVGSVRSLAAAAQLAIAVINHLKTAFNQMQQVGMHAMELLITGFQFGMASLINIVQSFGPRVVAAFKTGLAPLKTEMTTAMNEVNQAAKTGMTQLNQTITSTANQIKTTWTTFTKTFQTSWDSAFNALKAKWTADFNTLKTTSQTAWNAIKTAWTTFTKTFQTAWNSAAAALKSKWTADWNAIKTAGTTAWDAIKTAFTTFTKTFDTAWTAAASALKAKWTADWTAIKTSGQTIWDSIKTAFIAFGAALNTAWSSASDKLKSAWKATWDAMNATAASSWKQIEVTIGTQVNNIIRIVNGLIGAWNKVAGAVNLPTIGTASPVSFAEGGIVPGYAEGGIHMGVNLASGGVLGGYEPGHDSVPAMLSKGEGVLVPEAVRGLGEGFVHSANHHFSGGRAGHRGGHFEGGRQHFAAGGIAGGAFGLPDPAQVTAMFKPLIAELNAIKGWAHGAGAAFGGVGQKMLDKLIQAIQAKIAAMMAAMAAAGGGGAGGPISGAVGNLSALALKALGLAGLPASELGAFLALIQQESSGNPNARNPSGASGLAQVIPSTFAAFNITGGSLFDPLSNLAASAAYSKATYGGIHETPLGYANGTDSAARGWAMVGEDGPEFVNFGGGEKVMNNRDSMRAFGESQGSGSGGCTINVNIDARGATPEAVDKLKAEAIPQLRMALQAGVGRKGR